MAKIITISLDEKSEKIINEKLNKYGYVSNYFKFCLKDENKIKEFIQLIKNGNNKNN